jgi:uncharacterized membrane protein YdbT with pleckstrin-like domain
MSERNLFRYFVKNLSIVFSLVLIWRGIWYGLDWLDRIFLGTHAYTAIGGIILGILLLYLPDKDLKEIEKL